MNNQMQGIVIEYPSSTFDADVVRIYKTSRCFQIRIALTYNKIDAARRMINIYKGGTRKNPAWRAIFDGPRLTDLLSPLSEVIKIGGYTMTSREDGEYIWIQLNP